MSSVFVPVYLTARCYSVPNVNYVNNWVLYCEVIDIEDFTIKKNPIKFRSKYTGSFTITVYYQF